MKILFISPFMPYPISGGAHIRIHNLLTSLSSLGSVDWLGVTFKDFSSKSVMKKEIQLFSETCQSARVYSLPVHLEPDQGTAISQLFGHGFSSLPLVMKYSPIRPFLSYARELAKNADLIWIERLSMAHWLREFGHKIVVDVDDIEVVRTKRELENEKWSILKAMKLKGLKRLESLDRKSINNFQAFCVCSEGDKSFWDDNVRDKIWVIPNGCDDSLLDIPQLEKIDNTIVFVGTLFYKPNHDAILYFYQDIYPLIKPVIPDLKLWIVGRSPTKDILDMHDGKSIFVKGDVESVTPFVQQASLSIVPLRAGAGTRLKILESLALNTPVISTSIGAEGLDLIHNKDILICDNPQNFADGVINLLQNKKLAEQLAANGRTTVSKKYRWSSIRKKVVLNVQNLYLNCHNAQTKFPETKIN